jgi:hypothetical protein
VIPVSDTEFPRRVIAIALTLGVPAFVIATISTTFVVDYSVRSDLILTFRGHVIGGTIDMAVASVLAVAFGAVSIGLLRLWTEVRMWRERQP